MSSNKYSFVSLKFISIFLAIIISFFISLPVSVQASESIGNAAQTIQSDPEEPEDNLNLSDEEIANLLLTYKIADVNMDGQITTYDAFCLLEHCSESRVLSKEALFLADVTGDGKVTTYDAVRILEYIAGIYPPKNPPSNPYVAKGVDVSKYQGNIDWAAAKDDGINFAIIRAGYGKYENQKDEYFEKNYAACKELGIPVGVYHFSYALTVDDAIKEANFLLSWIKGKSFEYPVFFDIEHYTHLGVKLTSDIVKAFCTIIEDNGYYVGVYSYSYYLENYIDYNVLKWYSVWVADLSKGAVSYTGAYDMWQYSHTGSVKGINGNVDLNYCYKNYPKIMIDYNLNGF